MYTFNTQETLDRLVDWVKNYFAENAAPETKAVIGISGGKDSSVAAAVCVKALGKERVIGVLMPQNEQSDIAYSRLLVDTLGIKSYTINIGETVSTFMAELSKHLEPSRQAQVNTPARVRMTTLYAVAASVNGRVVNTCNLSEDWVGYSTRYGDSAGDFSPCSHLTVQEMKAIGHLLGLPAVLVDKVPSDGLCGKTDEDNLGFTYAELDRYIREGIIENQAKKERIDRLHEMNAFKLQLMPAFDPEI